MKWIKRLCSFLILAILILTGVICVRGYMEFYFFGNGYFCVADASWGYFGKPPSEMNFDECTLLAGIPNAPTNYNPVASPELARERQAQVVEKMKKAGYISEE